MVGYISRQSRLVLNHSLYVERQAAGRIEAYNVFVSRIEELELHEAVDARPLLDVRAHPHADVFGAQSFTGQRGGTNIRGREARSVDG